MTKSVVFVVVLAVLTLVQQSNAACDVKQKPGILTQGYPTVRDYYGGGYKLLAEINDPSKKSTMYLTEYYDTTKQEGYLEFTVDKVLTKVYYRHETEEIFVFDSYKCRTVDIRSPPDPLGGFLRQWTFWRRNHTVLGVSALFTAPSYTRKQVMFFQGPGEDVRGIRTNKWAGCVRDEDEPLEIYFSDPTQDLGYGTRKALPVRIRQGKAITDIMMMQPYTKDPEQKLQIPMGVGCTRLTEELPRPPEFTNIRMEFHSELAFTNPTVNGNYHYMSHLDVIHDEVYQHFSYIYAPWDTAAPNSTKLKALKPYQEIFDSQNGIWYTRTEGNSALSCSMAPNDNYRPVIKLPDNSTINILDTIFPDYKFLEKANYLGTHMVRSMPTHTFEVVSDSIPIGGKTLANVILTYSYMRSGTVVDTSLDQRNLPVRVIMKALTSRNGKPYPYFYFYANIHDVSTAMEDLNEKMSVLPCYTESESTFTWFQVQFPVTEELATLLGYKSQIKSKFMTKFMQITSLSYMRIPRVLVDFTSNSVYVTVLILERPFIDADYDRQQNFAIASPEWSVPVVTLDECLKMCSSKDYKECSAVGYCGSSCFTTSATNVKTTPGVLVKSTDCTTYVKTEKASRRNLPLTQDALDDVRKAVKNSEFEFLIQDNNGTKLATLIAESTDDSLGSLQASFGERDKEAVERHKRVGANVQGFRTAALGFHLKPSSQWTVHLGAFSLDDCADICRDREDCVSFSSCLGRMECIIGTNRQAVFDATERQTMCSVFSKSFMDNFEEFDGISLDVIAKKFAKASMAGDCAALCAKEKNFNCKSFDYCSFARDPNTACRLHDTHLRDFVDPSKMNPNTVEKCTHFSKKYLQGFKKNTQNRYRGDVRLLVRNIAAEECAKQCREATFPCQQFDFCVTSHNRGVGDCQLYDVSKGTPKVITSPFCSSYSSSEEPDTVVLRRAAQKELHSNGSAGGLAFFMILLGAVMGVAAAIGYGYYRNRQANRG